MNKAVWPRIRPGLCSVTFRNLSVSEIATAAAAAGLEGIEWGSDKHVPIGDVQAANDAAAKCADLGLEVPSYGTYLGMEPSKDDPKAACETAAHLGATNIRVWTPFNKDGRPSQEQRKAITQDLSRVAITAAEFDLTVGIEFHGWTLTETASSASKLIRDIDQANMFSYWQPNYWNDIINEDPDAQQQEFRVIADDVSHVHVYWWVGQQRRALAEGSSTWRPVLASIEGLGRWSGERFAFLEFLPQDDVAVLKREVDTLKQWLPSS